VTARKTTGARSHRSTAIAATSPLAASALTTRPLPLSAVARHAGVSTMTVSRVINHDPRVLAATAKAVRAAIIELGYIPRAESDGRRLSSRARRGVHTGRVAVLFPDVNLAALRTPLSASLLDGIDRRLADHRMQLLVTRLPEDQRLPDCLEPRQADGVLIRSGPDWVVPALRGFPAVMMLETAGAAGCDQVIPDSALIGSLAADRLAARGCRRALLVDDMARNPAHGQRRAAFEQRLRELGLAFDYLEVAVADAPLLRSAVAQQIADVAGLGIFMPGTDHVVRLVMQVVAEAARNAVAPASAIAVVACCHDRDLLATLPHAIDNIDIGAEAIATTAVDLLLQRLADPAAPLRRVVVQPVVTWA
jgi:LacI family transcriptional regulator